MREFIAECFSVTNVCISSLWEETQTKLTCWYILFSSRKEITLIYFVSYEERMWGRLCDHTVWTQLYIVNAFSNSYENVATIYRLNSDVISRRPTRWVVWLAPGSRRNAYQFREALSRSFPCPICTRDVYMQCHGDIEWEN